MNTKFELVIMLLNRPFLGLKQPDSFLTLTVKVPSLDSPLLNGSLQGVNALSSRVDVLCEPLVTQSELLKVMSALTDIVVISKDGTIKISQTWSCAGSPCAHFQTSSLGHLSADRVRYAGN